MIQRIVCILIVVLLQMAATSCSATKQSAHTVCPEPTMTLSDDNADRHCDSAPSASDLMTHQKAGLTLPATETFAAQSRTQARTNHWQWQRSLRCDARMRILAGNRRHAVSSDVLSQTFGIDTQSTGYVFVIRHIIIWRIPYFLQIKARHGFSQTPRHNTIVKLKNKESWNQNLKFYHIRTATT